MQNLGLFFIVFLILCIYLSTICVPPNQLTVYRASAKLNHILTDRQHSFSLTLLNRGPLQGSNSKPYLFIHGHKGNVKQAISMAMHFYYNNVEMTMYSIDFSEGAVAVSYDLLLAEAEFTILCIKEIEKRHGGQSITIIGHSFGGIVAALALGKIRPGIIDGIIALGTPFESPPINSDYRMLQAYNSIYKYIGEANIFIISITGGIRDLVVPSQFTNVNELKGKNSMHIYSTSISGLHKEIDHVAMVWGKEFFEVLGQIVQLTKKVPSSKLISEIKHLVTSEFSLMVQALTNETEATIVKLDKSQKLEKHIGLLLGEHIYYIFPGSSIRALPSTSKTQKINVESSNFSFASLLLGVKIPLKVGENLGNYINFGPQFSESRFPLHIKVLGEGQVQAVLAKCGHEEIIKYNENDFILYFHEHCTNGPEIWMLGYDEEFEYTIEVEIDLLASLVSLTRDFRLHIFTAMFYLSLVNLAGKSNTSRFNKQLLWPLHGIILVCLYFYGRTLRNLTVFEFEYFKADQNINYGVLDLIYIVAAGEGLLFLFSNLSDIVELMSKKLGTLGKATVFILPLMYLYPWPCFLILLITVRRSKVVGKIVFLTFLSLLPQNIGWHIALFTHNIHGSDAMTIAPCLLLILGSHKDIDLSFEILVASIVVGLFCQDFLNRIAFVFQAICLIGSIRIAMQILTKSLKSKKD